MSLERWLSYSVRREYLDRDLDAAKTAMRGRVLEIGNGRAGRRGRFQPPIQECDWLFVDIDPARRPHVRADAAHLPFADGTFDTVVALEMLEYVDSPQAALREMRRVLQPGGSLVLSVPFLHRADSDHDFWRATEHGLKQWLAECGFAVTWMRPQGYAFAVVANILKHAVYVSSSGIFRSALTCMLYPLIGVMLRCDTRLARRLPSLATFSTGYLALAQAVPKGSRGDSNVDLPA